MAKKKLTTEVSPETAARRRHRSEAQIAAEKNYEDATAKLGKTLVRHTKESARALKVVMGRFEVTGPEALRMAIVELAAKKN